MQSSETKSLEKLSLDQDYSRLADVTASPGIEVFRNKFVCGDALDVMRQMPDMSLDLVITSPPYNLKTPQAME